MFNFKKKTPTATTQKDQDSSSNKSWIKKLGNGLNKTKQQLNNHLGSFFLGKKDIDDDLLDELETALLLTDVGIEATDNILNQLKEQVTRKQLKDSVALFDELRTILKSILQPLQQTINITEKPHTILMVGINGAGKTTSIAKIAHHYKLQKKSIMLAAGDTFRAAAIEQLQAWGNRNMVPVVAQHQGADSASVIYDALASAQAKGIDLLIADTAGRLHTQDHLMQELIKVKRVMTKLNSKAPHETLLILDAGIGQNAIAQCEKFHEDIGLTGLCITKLDGTAKGGIIFALADKFKLPIYFIGVGENIDDLKPFNADDFVDALFAAPEQIS
jgi:fused signal recognition particle receptor